MGLQWHMTIQRIAGKIVINSFYHSEQAKTSAIACFYFPAIHHLFFVVIV